MDGEPLPQEDLEIIRQYSSGISNVHAEQVGRYIFVMPHCGEFYCVLGEIRDGQMIPLHEDDFYMK